eukprot:CAMPEP_0182899436 /NCGR_PEP_ID=MMETSP0034_2-20130328/28077_1 /TAXON_ID=156128 /ORGANISM="Nephroselmis pyriformis, Strain CCMP717" /LENGTH=142 /DNA_ID=CAMNT_0025033469 /DNA_START=202 /DNA_END=626 /DNA_ORIENTATION=-
MSARRFDMQRSMELEKLRKDLRHELRVLTNVDDDFRPRRGPAPDGIYVSAPGGGKNAAKSGRRSERALSREPSFSGGGGGGRRGDVSPSPSRSSMYGMASTTGRRSQRSPSPSMASYATSTLQPRGRARPTSTSGHLSERPL